MPNMTDYLIWRGDLKLNQVFLSPVDALIFSALSYLHFDGLVPEATEEAPSLWELSQMFQELPKEAKASRFRNERDEELLKAAGESRRFGTLKVSAVENVFDEQREVQFAAMTFLLGNGCAFLAFRGTDGTLTGWKEDFNLSFLDTIPGQWEACAYLEKIAACCPGDLYVGGHSKGGNLAVFAAAKCDPAVQERIRAVYNYDGPGFSRAVLRDPGYQAVLGRIRTFVPQSSVVGMLLEHEEPYTVVRSEKSGLFQHEPYSWEVLGSDFIRLDRVTEGSRMADETVKDWLLGLTPEERERFVETVFELLQAADIEYISELAQPKRIYAIVQKFGQEDMGTRYQLIEVLLQLAGAVSETIRRYSKKELTEKGMDNQVKNEV